MRLIFVLLFAFTVSCKCYKKPAADATQPVQLKEGFVWGTVSDKFKEKGCGNVIILSDGSTILIPKDALTEHPTGSKITFKYRPLRMKNPEGCDTGTMAEITEAEKIK